MNNSSVECRLKALEILISEFEHEDYASFVKKELDALISGEREKIGFQSEGDDVVFDLTLDGAFIEYNYWDKSKDDFVQGKGDLEYGFVVEKIIQVIST